MGLLDRQLARQLLQGFQGKNILQAAKLWRAVPTGGLDSHGDPVSSTPTLWDFQGFTEDYNDAFRRAAGIPELDIRVNIFGASLPPGIIPMKDDKAFIAGQWWQIRKPGTDPAKALYVCQSFGCETP
jgi:hypothetical protein